MKKPEDRKEYVGWGLTAFFVIAGCIGLYLLITRWGDIQKGINTVLGILSPFIWGFVIAYLLRPLVRVTETHVTVPLGSKLFKNNAHRAFVFGRAVAILASQAFMIFIIVILLRMIIPQMYSSIESIATNSGKFYEDAIAWARSVLDDYPKIETAFVKLVGDASDTIVDWAKETVLPTMTGVITNITSGVVYFLRGVYYVAVGVIASVYILYNKEAAGAGIKKILYSVLSLERAEKLLKSFRFSDGIFLDFISGKILDSAIIGVICYISCLIMGMPYPILIAVIVGVTNVIPFFGPFIGAIPSGIIILTVSPIKCLIFGVFIIALQQFDGNILGPKILGGKIGINGFWIMFSIIMGAGLFGFVGMLLGVPVFMIIYTGISSLVDKLLGKKGLPTDGAYYENLLFINPVTKIGVERPPEPTFEEKQKAKAEKRAIEKQKSSEKGERLFANVISWRSKRKEPPEKSDSEDSESPDS